MPAIPASIQRLLPDNFTLALLATVAIATVLPCTGEVAAGFGKFSAFAIGALFFLHGAKLPREAIIAGLTHWRLHLLVLCCTFVLFPIMGLLIKPAALAMMAPDLYPGILFLCMLPSTVQSSIGFTAMARGNVAAAVCSASASSFLGIFITPLLVGALVAKGSVAGSGAMDTVMPIVFQLLLPFIAGQILRPAIGKWVDRHKPALKYVDQGAILLVVYTAFSDAVAEGLWHKVPLSSLAALVVLCCMLLAAALLTTAWLGKRFRFSREDKITIVFCGSKKSLASGVPMAKVLFASSSLGMIILPLMLFHQIQLMVCAVLAQRFARREV